MSLRRGSNIPAIILAFAASSVVGCGNSGNVTASASTGDSDSETGTSSDTGTDSDADTDTGDAAAPTWYQEVAPLVAEKCSNCHEAEGIAPFSLTSYEEAKDWATLLADTVEEGTMPPFLADETDECTPRFGWKDDVRLADEEIAMLRAWADAGAPEGDPTAATPLPEAPSTELEDADIRLTIPSAVTIDGAQDRFVCFSIDPGYDLDTWVNGLQIHAGNPKIVHHVLIYIDENAASADLADQNGQYDCFGGAGVNDVSLIGAWAPGMLATSTPPDTAYRIPAGSRIIVNVHYHPTGAGAEIDDSTSLDLRYHPSLPAYLALLVLLGNDSGPHGNGLGLQPGPGDTNGIEFKIPAGVSDHRESMITQLDDIPTLKVFATGTHMHYVGSDMQVKLKHKNPQGDEPETECLLQTPDWDFGWQRNYDYDVPLSQAPEIRDGDQIHLRCDYNNSLSNPFVVDALKQQGLDAPVDVRLGEETLDEMCLGIFGVAIKLSDL